MASLPGFYRRKWTCGGGMGDRDTVWLRGGQSPSSMPSMWSLVAVVAVAMVVTVAAVAVTAPLAAAVALQQVEAIHRHWSLLSGSGGARGRRCRRRRRCFCSSGGGRAPDCWCRGGASLPLVRPVNLPPTSFHRFPSHASSHALHRTKVGRQGGGGARRIGRDMRPPADSRQVHPSGCRGGPR